MANIPIPVEAKKFLKDKTIVETEAWDDLQWGEHSHVFTIAHSVGAGAWDKFTPPEWRYNPGREALAPSFDKYKNLERAGLLEEIKERYRADIKETQLTLSEMLVIRDEMKKRRPTLDEDIPPNNPIQYLVGTIDKDRQEKMSIDDSKIMITGYRIYHALDEKNKKQEIPKNLYPLLYETIQNPDEIHYRVPQDKNEMDWEKKHGKEYHFSKHTKNNKGKDKILNVVMRKQEGCSLQIITMGLIEDKHGILFKPLW